MSKLLVKQSGSFNPVGHIKVNESPMLPAAILDDGIDASTAWRPEEFILNFPVTPLTATAWMEILPSLTANVGGVYLALTASTFVSGNDTRSIMEIGVGAEGSETPVIQVPVGNQAGVSLLMFPGLIAAGSRVSYRIRSSQKTTGTLSGRFSFIPDFGVGQAQNYGGNPATGGGVEMAYASSSVLPSDWYEVTESTIDDIDILGTYHQLGGDSTTTAGGIYVEVAVGPESFETIVSRTIALTATAEYMTYLSPNVCRVPHIPAGSRLSARFSTNSSAHSVVDVMLVGCAAT